MDNGPECSGRRTQFLLRMTEFADMTGLTIHLVYYPPYHSKYNAIERYWAGLGKSWNGYLLDTAETVPNRAGNFVWKGSGTTVKFLETAYEKGVKICGKKKKWKNVCNAQNNCRYMILLSSNFGFLWHELCINNFKFLNH